MSNFPIKVGMVGASRGQSFMLGFQHAPETEVVALCDRNPQALQDVADQYGIAQRFTEYEALLESAIDVVVVSTPMPLHVPMVVAALAAGKHVISEVPAATDLKQCFELRQAVARSDRKYMMAENCCFLKANVLVNELVRAGFFGELYFGEGEYTHELKALNQRTPWRRIWQAGRRGGTYITHNLGPLLMWFNTAQAEGAPPITVNGVAAFGSGNHYVDWRGVRYENDDVTLLLCRLSDGGLLKLRNDLLSERPKKNDYQTLQGTKGCYEVERNAPYGNYDAARIWLQEHHPKDEWHLLREYEDEYLPAAYREAARAAEAAGHGGSDYFQVRAFIDCIVHDTLPPIDIDFALDMTVPGLISQLSLERGGAMLPLPNFRTMRNFPDDLPPELRGSSIVEVDLPLQP